jgi:hypothetical protein
MSDLPKTIEGMDWPRLALLIKQTRARIELWEVEELRAERRWHRGLREVDRRGLTNPDSVSAAYVAAAARERVWVPTSKLEQDRELLAHLYRLRDLMLGASDGSECEA